jgi:ABC-type uncharacterized transport system substrate-binding protein
MKTTAENTFWSLAKRVWLSLALLGAGALILLLSDTHSRVGARRPSAASQGPVPVALLKHASNRLLDELENGVLEKLAAEGYRDGEKIALRRFNAEGDLPTANAIARQITDGSYRMAISISTLSLQCVANANRAGRAIHVFGGVTDPAGAGVGVERMNSTNKPPWLAGMGTFQPVGEIFREARRLWPGLKTVGVVWNPAERNSETCTLKAREVCGELGLQLHEATVEQSKDVLEAAASLVARGVQAFWTGADVTVNSATATLCDVALRAGLPVFSNTSGQVREGTLFDLGADYTEVGQRVGELAAGILGGLNPASVVISNYMPARVMLNRQVLARLRDGWRFPADLVSRAELILGPDGRVEKDSGKAAPALAALTQAAPANRPYKIGLAYFGPDEGTDTAIAGLLAGLRELKLSEGRNLTIRRSHANGEISGIPAVLQALDSSGLDAIVPFSTPVITAACATVRRTPVVFTYCVDPIAAGVGKSFEDHLPQITGIGSFPPVEEAVALMKLTLPGLKRLGALYNNSEANSVKIVSVLRGLCAARGIELVEAVANGTSEVVPATQSLAARGVEAVYLPSDNTAYQAFDGLSGQLADRRIPLVIDTPEFLERGALAVVGVGFYQAGWAAAQPLARVLAGEKPAQIPLRNVSHKQVRLNFEVARKLGITFPAAVLAMQTAAQAPAAPAASPAPVAPPASPAPVAPPASPAPAAGAPGKPWRIQQISYLESPMVEESARGFNEGLREAGLRAGVDYTVKTLCAQGDMAALGTLFDSARSSGVDLYGVFGTPTLQAAIRKVTGTPVIFTVVADPILAGAGESHQVHRPNVAGVYTQGPYREMAELLGRHFPQIKRVGTLFCPAEVNSVGNKDLFTREAARCGLAVEAVAANTATDLPDAALALCGRQLDAVVQVIDNLTVAGFPTIARAAEQARLPVFTFQSATVKLGAVFALALDYHDTGRDAAGIAVRVLRGESPAKIPFAPPGTVRKFANPAQARARGLTLPEELLRDAVRVPDPRQP